MRYGSRLVIQLNLLEENHRAIKNYYKTQNILMMVKADAYGHGLIPISRFAHLEMGVNDFGTASLGEALTLRGELADQKCNIYVFSDIQLDLDLHREVYLNRRILPVLKHEEELELFLKDPEFKFFPLCLKFNTGMNRLGLKYDRLPEVIKLLKKYDRKEIYHLMTHFSSSSLSMTENKRNIDQREKFASIKSELKNAGIDFVHTSIANSGAIEQGFGIEETFIRPGILIYGPSSLLPKIRNQAKIVTKVISQLESYIIDVFPIEKGTPIGYGATPCPDDGQIAIMALGYGDGFSTTYQNVELEIEGRRCKIVGRVNMDMCQVLVPKDLVIKRGQTIVVWDHERTKLERICEQSNTIPYEVLCRISPRVPRIYQLK